ncbi:hypothetical protein GCM10009555_003080 [Acrocarpospora macrocephala]|uniref:Uncharacterized protein n=1 Tax=Acrocarpospora macrocephala TaxID=150177 RepID=A0A5M3WZD2_9ACTN|nr:hypothetical protein [Acrocarpospora macrocephala]GES11783.1 hypothetical protein Amac_053800 [Acrocarpospora macrocephala]
MPNLALPVFTPVVFIAAGLIAVTAATYLYSADPGRRARALRLLRMLLRR